MENLIKQAAKFLENGGVVSLPTETVYSLSANATDDLAVNKIYNLKGRKKDNPLALLVGSILVAREVVLFNKHAEMLAEAFFPGPLSLVLPIKKNTNLSKFVNEGLDTLSIRMPKHTSALEVLNSVNFPVVGTSANPSGLPAATDAKQVSGYFAGKLEMVLDGGACDIGMASTIIDLSSNTPKILRQGSITAIQIEEILRS